MSKNTVIAIYEKFNQLDAPGLAELVTDDFELTDMALGYTWAGREGLQQWLSLWATSMPDVAIELHQIIGEGKMIATEHTGRGTHTGPLMTPAGEVPATGKAVEVKAVEIFTLRDGKVARMKTYWDIASFMRQLGLA